MGEDIVVRAKKMGLSPTTPVRHYYWGKLEEVYRDPDGVIVVFTQAYNPEDAQKLGADETWVVAPRGNIDLML